MLRCPKCGSTDLYQVLGGYAGTRYRCKRCGYTGSFVVESDEELPPLSEEDGAGAEKSGSVYRWIKIIGFLLLVFIALNYLVGILRRMLTVMGA
ncbi:hypothetical protein RJ40_03035 [Methanofollis aquaemaris]|uniref:Uncharacterized protein n=1 Tax=Methanofollis aquaemaris TaxID=126734 RepID=A0A8A3S4I3_9EURY|nr:hypothetical protein [Methanofollis aquaemaris]QSZ66546.1 hypothetical protein RJ40_03035 [Methanofollis aquaemaris]